MSTTPDFVHQKCVPCEGDTAPLSSTEIQGYLSAVPGWEWRPEPVDRLVRDIKCDNFLAAVELLNQVAKLAEADGHHPNVRLHDFKFLELEFFTHAIQGLSQNDFIMAAKVNELLVAQK